MEIGHKVYYDLITGMSIQHIWQASGEWIYETTREEDFALYLSLKERDPETVGLITLPFGECDRDFRESREHRVNLETGALEFSYPDPNEPEVPPIHQPPLTVQIADLKTQLAEAQAATLEMHEGQLLQDAKIAEANNATLELYELIAQGGMV